MKNRFKKALCASLICLLLCPLLNAFSLNVGDKIEQVLSTDIITYVEGVRVPSFNIAGRTAIIVENLNAMDLPFNVWYDELTRTLTIQDGTVSSRDYFYFEDTESSDPIGTPIMDVLHTDIETFYAGTKLDSFNIGGFTCIYATDFAALYGRYTWDEENRAVNIFRQKDEIEGEVFYKEVARKLPADESTIEKGDTFVRWGNPSGSHLIKGEDDSYCIIEVSDNINIEKYDLKFNHISSSKIKPELPIFGTFLEGDEYNYMVFGQENTKDSDTLPVIKIVVYDKKFKKVKDIPIKECKTSVPFDASNVSLAEDENYLVLHTSRSQYDEKGRRPQTQLTVIINKEDWTIVNSLDKFQPNHTSHALKGFVKTDGDKIVTANYSDANPVRGAFVQELDFSGNLLSTYTMFKAGGPSGANCTGAMLGGFEISDSSYLLAVSSIDHSLATDYSDTHIEGIVQEERDIYIVSKDKKGGKANSECLTYYSGEGKTASVPYLVSLEDGNFMVMWQKFSQGNNKSKTFCYAFVDEKGALIGDPMQAEGYLSQSCQPVEIDGKVTWYVNTSSGRIFYQIDSASVNDFN